MNKLKRISTNTLITIAPAVIVYLLFMLVTHLFGEAGFGVGGDLKTILYNTLYSGFIALALSYNLTSGRFDFSVGSVLLLSVIAGGNLAKEWDLGPFGMLLICLVIGMICGLISGIIYITLKLPPMVSSLGVAMVFEAIGFTINKGNISRIRNGNTETEFTAEILEQSNADAVAKVKALYDNMPFRAERKAENLVDILCSWGCKPYVVYQGGEFKGYFSMKKNYPYLKDFNFLKLLYGQHNKTTYANITVLDWAERPLQAVEARIISASCSVNGDSSVRRTANLTVKILMRHFFLSIST